VTGVYALTGGAGGRQRVHCRPQQDGHTGPAGALAGATTMVANAAGPVIMVYLPAMRLPKDEFLGTGAWFFAVVNWVKVPFNAGSYVRFRRDALLRAVLYGASFSSRARGTAALMRTPPAASSFDSTVPCS